MSEVTLATLQTLAAQFKAFQGIEPNMIIMGVRVYEQLVATPEVRKLGVFPGMRRFQIGPCLVQSSPLVGPYSVYEVRFDREKGPDVIAWA